VAENITENGSATINGFTMKATFVAENITENGSATINGITMKASSEVCGVITSITLASGQVIAYRL